MRGAIEHVCLLWLSGWVRSGGLCSTRQDASIPGVTHIDDVLCGRTTATEERSSSAFCGWRSLQSADARVAALNVSLRRNPTFVLAGSRMSDIRQPTFAPSGGEDRPATFCSAIERRHRASGRESAAPVGQDGALAPPPRRKRRTTPTL